MMAQEQTIDIEEQVTKYIKALEDAGKQRNKFPVILDDIDEESIECAIEEDEISVLKYLESVPYAYISHNANNICTRLDNACIDVVNIKGYTNTASAPYFQSVFKKELNKCQKVLNKKQFRECGDMLIAILLTLKHWPHGFYDCENGGPDGEAQQILDKFGTLWSKVIGKICMLNDNNNNNKSKKQTLLTSYFKLNNNKLTKKQNNTNDEKSDDLSSELIDLDKYSKKVLYDVIKEVNNGLKEMGFDDGFKFGNIPKDIIGINGHQIIQIENGNDKNVKSGNKKRKLDEIDDDNNETKVNVTKKRKLNNGKDSNAIAE
eukprot:285648_1